MALAINRTDMLLMEDSDEKLFLSNIINHGESDVQWPISI